MADKYRLGVVPDWRNDPDMNERYSQRELQKLMNLAIDYPHPDEWRHAPCEYLYRNKTRNHFQNVKRNYDNRLIPCLKDSSGDERSPINGKLYGLFFTASVQPGSTNGKPLPKSPFGNTRLMLPVEYLIEGDTNLYFADFYCLHSNHHYVTLVVTKRFSEADKFCWRHLIKLDITDNPFLFYNSCYDEFNVIDVEYLIVEVIYTHEISLYRAFSNGGYMIYDVPTIGKGYVTDGGIPKNEDCPLCNIYL